MDIQYQLSTSPKPKTKDESTLRFGRTFSDHMFEMHYSPEKGWHDQQIHPYGPMLFEPASPVLHYAQEIFEGMKAYHHPDGEIRLFRPLRNLERLNNSARRMAMPTIDIEANLAYIDALVDLERDWVPKTLGTALYLRPAMVADGAFLGAKKAQQYRYFIICSPSGPYYEQGIKPVSIWIEKRYVRAVRGGTGDAKTGGNYASSFLVTSIAQEAGYNQVLWLDGKDNRYVEEVGAMNIFFVYGKKLVTPPLGGSILPGITRDSILQLAPELGLDVSEERIDIYDLLRDIQNGRVTEAFGCGTAAILSPINRFGFDGKDYLIADKIGDVTQLIYDTMTGIQYGTNTDTHNWLHTVARKRQID